MVNLLRGLDRRRFRVCLATSLAKSDAYVEDLPKDVDIIDLGRGRLRYAVVPLTLQVWRRRPDIVFSTLDYLNIALAAVRWSWPRTTRLIVRPTLLTDAVPRLRRLLMGLTLPAADLVILQSEAMEESFRRAFAWAKQNTVVIRNPVDLHRVRALAAERARSTLDPTRLNLVAAGRLDTQKGFDLLLRAVHRVGRSDVALTILGEGPLLAALTHLSDKLGLREQVRFVGFQPNPYPYLAAADLFVLSSRFEGFPNVVLEALACGTPVVSTPVPGIAELARKVPELRVAATASVEDLAETLQQFLASDMTRPSSNALEDFDSGPTLARYGRVMTQLLD